MPVKFTFGARPDGRGGGSRPDGAHDQRRSSSEQTLDGHNGHQNGDTEKGSGQDESKKPVGFFNPSLNAVRKEVLLGWVRITVILSVFVLAVLSLYWAVQFHVYQNMPSLLVYVVDMDGAIAPYDTGGPPLVGPAVVQAAQKQLNSKDLPHLGYAVVPGSKFNNDPVQVRQSIYDYDAWAAIVVNPNATFLLRAAIASGNASYDPLGAAQTTYVQARDETTMANYIIPMLSTLQTEITTQFAAQWIPLVLANATSPALLRSPQAISPAIGFSTFNLRPFKPPVTTPAITIGLIYLIIISFFSFSFYLPLHMRFITPSAAHPPLKFQQLVLFRYTSALTSYLFLSLSYSLISLCFQIPFSYPPAPQTSTPTGTLNASLATAFGRGSFPAYWALNFLGMIALGLACENVAMLVGQPWMALWLIFWVITNVSTAFYEIALSPRFYVWGYAWPLHNVVEGSRSVIFDLHSRRGLNFGVLVAWGAVNTLLYPGACWVMRWKSERAKRKEKGKEG